MLNLKKSKNTTLKKLTSLIMSVLLLLTCFTGCNSANKQNDDVHFISKEEYEENNSIITSGVTLKEITSTGEIPYEYFLTQGDDSLNYLYNTYKYGDYTNYLDTELFPFRHNNKVGYADAYGNVVISEQYDQAGFFSENKAFVKKDDVWKVIDPEGNELFTVPSGYVPENEPLFQNGISMLYNKDWDYYEDYSSFNVLVINKDFSTKEVNVTFPDRRIGIELIRPITTPEFSGFLLFSTKTVQVGNIINGQTYYYIDIYDLNGNSIWRAEFEDYYDFEDSYRTFNESGCCRSSRDSNEILENSWLFEAQNGYINVVDSNGKWGLFNLKTKKLIIPCKYDYVGVASDDGVVNICSYGKWGYIDINNNTLLKPQFKYTGELQNGRAFAITEEGKDVIIDKNGNILNEVTTEIRSGLGGHDAAIIANSEKTGIFISVSSNTSRYLTTTVFDSKGKYLVSGVQAENFYVSDKYIFLGGKMYEIIK